MKILKWAFSLLLLSFFALVLSQLHFSENRADCAFCDPKLLSVQEVYRGAYVSVVLTHKPATDGHTLIVPHRHVERFEGLSEAEISEMGSLAIRVYEAVRSIYGAEEYILLQKNGAGAGQSVPHVHLHVIPKPSSMSKISFVLRIFTSSLLPPKKTEEMLLSKERLSSELEAQARQD